MNLSTVIANTNIPATLVRSVIRQCSDWDEFQDIAHDVVNHGADCGFSGFITHTETVAFTKRNRKHIVQLLEQQADDMGYESIYIMVAGFNCLNGEYRPDEIAESFYRDNDARTQVYNALAWYALEEVSRAVVEAIENEGE